MKVTMFLHDRSLIIISSLTIIAGGVALVSYAQHAKSQTPPAVSSSANTITYIHSEEVISSLLPPLTAHTSIVPDDIWQMLMDTGSNISLKPDYDFALDSSLQKYVSRHQSFDDKGYKPNDLVKLADNNLVLTQKNMQLRQEAATSLGTLAREFHETFQKKLVLVSAYRSYSYQQHIKKNGCPDTLCAPAGHSEHQGGLAIDLFAATTAGDFLSKADFKKYYDRLSENAHRYGRHNTYQKGVQIDSYQKEPRHWRYVGRDLARELYEKKLTLAELVKLKAEK